MLRPVAQVTRLCVCIAFGDAQVDLALAEIEKGSSLPSIEKRAQRQVQRQSLSCISTSDPTVLGRLLTDRHLDSRAFNGLCDTLALSDKFCGKLSEFCEKLGESALAHK